MTWPPTRDHALQAAVLAVLDRGVLVGGPEIEALEAEFAQALDLEHVVAVCSGTAAVTAALLVADIQPGDRVIVPAFTFSGSVLPIVHLGAVPVFVDVDAGTFCLDPMRALETASEVGARAILLVHLHGYPVEVPEDVASVMDNRGIKLIEDSCQAAGARLPQRCSQKLGRQGVASAYSLNEKKQVFAGEGGLVATTSVELAEFARRLRRYGEPVDQPSAKWRSYQSLHVGFNWKLAEIPAAIARVSLRDLEGRTNLAATNAAILSAAVAQTRLVPPQPGDGRHAWHKYRVRCGRGQRDAIMGRLRSRGVPVSQWQTSILPEMPAFRGWAGAFGQDYPMARSVISDTFVIGDETHPLCASTSAEVHRWAAAIMEEQL